MSTKRGELFIVVLIRESHFRSESGFLEVGDASEVDHRGRAAHQDDAVGGGGKEVLRDHVVVDEPCAVSPF